MGYIKCCRDCKAPKRHLGCHETCPEYIKERKQLDELNEKIRQKRLEEELAPHAKVRSDSRFRY